MILAPEPTPLQALPRPARQKHEELRAAAATFADLGLSERDRKILALARRHLEGAPADFDEVLRAVQASVEELIPAGRVYLIGATKTGPILGSIISGVGIVPAEAGALVVRARHGEITTLGSFFS
ncbi:hypothetical protein [Polyangium mundeleinium]|uniref:Uncharacterized protein n=1 Tax=Polyangium mundeleinium TaxID=2995306 RepID=A0ABT5F061_9BACT|nr:hypothetical protein [Polyangium mundeleinium]MDC0747473.1 hypothetical protein [Polyangium mundeleinium]